MAIITDTVMTVFAVRGVSSVLSAFKQLGDTTKDLAKKQMIYDAVIAVGLGENTKQFVKAQKMLETATIANAKANFVIAASAGAAFGAIVAGVEKAIQAYSDFGKEIMNIRDLTGASAAQSVQAAVLMKAAGMSDTQEIRDIMRLSSATFSAQGRAGLGKLGIPASPNAQGIDLFNSIAAGYQQSNLPQLMKTKILEDIFGIRGTAALMPLLRITKEERDEIAQVASAFDTKGLAAIQRFQVSSALLGITLQQQIIFPLAQGFMPIMRGVISVITFASNVLGGFNRLFLGFPAFVGYVGALAAAFGFAAVAVLRLWTAAKAMLVTLRATAAVQAFLTTLSGPAGIAKVGAGLAVAGGVLYGLNRLGQNGEGGGSTNSPANKMNTAADKMLEAAGMMQDQFSKYWKGPNALKQTDIAELSRRQALGAIG